MARKACLLHELACSPSRPGALRLPNAAFRASFFRSAAICKQKQLSRDHPERRTRNASPCDSLASLPDLDDLRSNIRPLKGLWMSIDELLRLQSLLMAAGVTFSFAELRLRLRKKTPPASRYVNTRITHARYAVQLSPGSAWRGHDQNLVINDISISGCQ